MDLPAEKRRLRAEVDTRLRALPPARRAVEEEWVTAAVQDTPEWRRARTLLVYRAVGTEFSVVGLTNAAWRAGKRVLFPRVVPGGEGTMTLHEVRAWAELRPGSFGIPEPLPSAPEGDPASADVALVPGLAWDRKGGRLGRGGGHYDRLIPRLSAAWGVGFDCQLVAQVPMEAHDAPVHRVWTAGLSGLPES